MERTDFFFKDLVDKGDMAGILDKFTELYCEQGYDLLLQDAAQIIDVEPKWLIRSCKDKFDYIIPPAPATQSFTEFIEDKMMKKLGWDVSDSWDSEYKRISARHFLKGTHILRRGLARKKVFVNRESFYKFLNEELKISLDLKRVSIPRSELYNLKDSELDKVRDEVLVFFELAEFDAYGNIKLKEEKNVKFEDTEYLDIEDYRLFSQRTLSTSGQVRTVYENPLEAKKIGDKRFRDWLDEIDVAKVTLKKDGNERPIVRYLLPEMETSIGELYAGRNNQVKKDNYVFNIDVDVNIAEAQEKFLFYLEFLILEGRIKLPNKETKAK